ncbi:MAG: GNAT family N-acetyltransferase [Acidimicrobiales bacterium]|jgi:N-acetylglutamate synthase-like GNAT family acetyltransferase
MKDIKTMKVRPGTVADREWIGRTLVERWTSTVIVTRSRSCDAAELDALVAIDTTGERVGLLTFRFDESGLEVVTIDSTRPGSGIGTALLATAVDVARGAGASRLWLITTNDNLDAVAFYQHRGLRTVAVHRGAVDKARILKPSIPRIGASGIELHDEIELELKLDVVAR